MPKTLCDDGVNVAVGASAAPTSAPEPAPAPEPAEPTQPLTEPVAAPEPEPAPEDADAARLRALIADLNVEDTLRLIDGGWSAEEVLAAEHATKRRSTVIDALTPDDEQEQ